MVFFSINNCRPYTMDTHLSEFVTWPFKTGKNEYKEET